MKNKIITCLFIQIGTFTLAQVGVNTPAPQATFDIAAKNTAGTSTGVDGLLIPRVDRQRAQSMTGVAASTLVYVNNVATGTATGTAINIDAVGYYYFDSNVWNKMDFTGQNIYNTNGTLSSNRTVSQTDKNLAFTIAASAGTSHFTVDDTTLNVDAVNNRVGIGTNVPNSDLQIVGNEVRVGGPSSQTGTVANPVLRIHSNANTDGSGGSLLFSENAQSFGYYIKQNTEGGNTYGNDGLAIGSAQAGKYPYNPARPGVFVSDVQNIGFGTATPQAMFHIDGARDNNINSAPTSAQQANDLVVNTSGNVGIGTIAPTESLDTTGRIRVRTTDVANGATVISPLYVDPNGVVVKNSPSARFGTLTYFDSGSVGAGVTGQITNTLVNGVLYKAIVYVQDGCANIGVAEYYVYNQSLNLFYSINGLGGMLTGGTTSKSPNFNQASRSTIVTTWTGKGNCAGGGTGIAFNYTLTVSAPGILEVTNNGDTSLNYRLVLTAIN
ncbi:hypothetical protein N0B40_04015 [Chryseobacterium oranimense]|uniref:hypothetical protein n=1 Tax=Chryseobacterium oranimense TaxID=421058 RepID=UPI0021AEE6EF|nr:hypothetical protein [Chryseobacterium oranimense]UWX61447.1 hypothetical protein N0B40_04015 [Chryseobacterium oranimense]